MKSQKIMELETLMPTEMDAGQVFTGTPTGKAVKGYKETCSYTPSVDPRYIFHESARDVVVWFMHDLDPLVSVRPHWMREDDAHQAACRTAELSHI